MTDKQRTIKLLRDQVLVELIEEEVSTSILIPDSAKKKPTEGKVLSIGMGNKNTETGKYDPLEVKVGDRVMFNKWTGTETKFNGKNCVILKETDIFGIIQE